MTGEPETASRAAAEDRAELWKEALTTALYVAICLLAALLAIPEGAAAHVPVLGLVWGVTVGLALAHWFAFRLSSRLVGWGRIRPADVASGAAQLVGAAAVAALASLGVLLVPDDAEVAVIELVLAALIGAVGYAVARGAGATVLRSVLYAGTVLVIAVAIAIVKNALAGH
jgi:hypothetical protein